MINRALGILENASEHGPAIDNMLEMVHWFMLGLFLIWTTFFIYVIVRFRSGKNPRASYTGTKSPWSSFLEFAVVIIEAVLLLGFAFPLWATRVNEFPTGDNVREVKVIAEQFEWNIYYPGPDKKFGKQEVHLVTTSNPLGVDRNDPNAKDDLVVTKEMHVPVNTPIIAHISSKDVIHSFSLRHMRITQDAIPGMSIPTWFTPIKTSAQIRENEARTYPAQVGLLPKEQVLMAEYKDKGGTIIGAKLTLVTDLLLKTLAEAGIREVKTAPEHPMEIMCAQLCGNGHSRMRGFLVVETQEEFDKWWQSKTAVGGGPKSYE